MAQRDATALRFANRHLAVTVDPRTAAITVKEKSSGVAVRTDQTRNAYRISDPRAIATKGMVKL
ncbi:MAG: hypothetical protein ABIF71_12790 [Planctomycetota bacterium]